MVLRNDGKGMISLVDAMIFVTLLSIVSVSLFSFYASEYQEEPMAKNICNEIISIDLRASDVFETTDSDTYSISDLIASGINSDRTEKIESYIENSIDELIPINDGYRLTITYGDRTMEFEREMGSIVDSEYSTDVDIINGTKMNYRLVIMTKG